MNHLNQRLRVIDEFRKNGKIGRNYAIDAMRITRLSHYIHLLRGEDWEIATVESTQPTETTYYLLWKPGMAERVSWPSYITAQFEKEKVTV